MENSYLTYKGRPLVRCGNEMYYGSMNDKYIVFIRELSTKKVNDVDVGSKFEIQLRFTDPDIKGKGKIINNGQESFNSHCNSIIISRELFLFRALAEIIVLCSHSEELILLRVIFLL